MSERRTPRHDGCDVQGLADANERAAGISVRRKAISKQNECPDRIKAVEPCRMSFLRRKFWLMDSAVF
jgi:hypothetical protein